MPLRECWHIINAIYFHILSHIRHTLKCLHTFFFQTDLRVILWRLACTYPFMTTVYGKSLGHKMFYGTFVTGTFTFNESACQECVLCSSYIHHECFYYYNFSVCMCVRVYNWNTKKRLPAVMRD